MKAFFKGRILSTLVLMLELVLAIEIGKEVFRFPAQALDLRENRTTRQGGSEDVSTPVLKIYSAAGSGSGVVIGEKDGVYTLLTSFHVIDKSSPKEIDIQLPGNALVKPVEIFRPFPSVDLAVVRFRHSIQLPVAILPFLDKSLWEKVDDWSSIEIVGFATQSTDVNYTTLRQINGKIVSLVPDGPSGYTLLYDAATTTGMSGGAVFGTNHLVWPRANDPESPTRNGYYYFNINESIKKLEAADRRAGAWIESAYSPSESLAYKKCMSRPDWKPSPSLGKSRSVSAVGLFEMYSRGLKNNRQALCMAWARRSDIYNCSFENFKNPAGSKLLLAIHGRSERYEYGGKSGTSLGVYLGSKQMSDWLQKNVSKWGIPGEYSYARNVCSIE